MKRKLLLAALCVVSALGFKANAQTDVTSTYLVNADFEGGYSSNSQPSSDRDIYLPSGWTLSYTNGEANDMTSLNSTTTQWNNFSGRPQPANGGSNTYWIRFRWGNSENLELSQTVTLPAGIYTLSVDAFLNASPKGVATISAAGKTTNVTNNNEWGSYTVTFGLIKSTEVKIACSLKQNQQEETVAAFDNFTLTYTAFDFSYATPVADNTTDLYFKNEATGQYLSAGHSWGTHATVDNYGQEITATLNEGIYSLKTQQYNAYLNSLYMDNGTSTPSWIFLETAASSGKYYMTQDGINYMTSNGAGAELVNVTSPTEASIWTIVSKADRKTTAMSSATINTPSDVTFLIADANFNRNANSIVWNGTSHTSDDKDNLNLAGGNDDNMCAESYHATFSIYQTLSDLEDGVYGLTAQGFYRQDGSDNEHLPYFYLGDEKTTFPVKTGSEGNMGAASTSFSAGLYTIDPIYVRVEGGSVELGAKLTDDNYNLWCIWDNFQLKYYGDVTVAAVKMKASVDAYNAAMEEAEAFTEGSMFADAWTTLQSAITTNTLDLNDPSLTESALNTATANLVAANAAATAAVTGKTTYNTAVTTIDGGTNVDLTSLITNPSFEAGSTTGWTNSGAITANAQNNSSFDNKQGTWYAERWHVAGTIDINQTVKYLPAGIYKVEAYLYSDVDDAKFYVNSENVSVSTSQKYFAVVEISDKGSIKMGASCTLTSSTWICLDDYKLTYLASSYATLPYTLATGKMGTDKATAQTVAEDEFKANPNMTTYEALLSAISDAEASVANYAKLKAAIDKAIDIKNANNFVTAAATTDFENEISTATTAWTNVTYTDDEAKAEITTLGTAVSGWHANATGAAGAYMASAWGKTNENWWDAPYINTWSTEGDNDGSGFSVPFFEWFVGDQNNLPLNTTLSGTLSGLENGVYEVELWARVQRRTDADFGNDNELTMSVNGGDAVSIMNSSTTIGSGGTQMRIGRYTARGVVTDGNLTISIKSGGYGSNVHWLSWRDVTYTKVAPATVPVTVGANGYTTFASPYALDLTDENRPAGLKAYKATLAGNELSFTAINQTVPAGTGLLLLGETKGGDYEIPVVASGDAIDNALVGVTSPTSKQSVEGGIYYFVMKKAANAESALEFAPLSTSSPVTIPEGKAYVEYDTKAGSKALRVVIDGQATEVVAPEVAETEEEEVLFNMAGVQVDKNFKGFVINQKGEKRFNR